MNFTKQQLKDGASDFLKDYMEKLACIKMPYSEFLKDSRIAECHVNDFVRYLIERNWQR